MNHNIAHNKFRDKSTRASAAMNNVHARWSRTADKRVFEY